MRHAWKGWLRRLLAFAAAACLALGSFPAALAADGGTEGDGWGPVPDAIRLEHFYWGGNAETDARIRAAADILAGGMTDAEKAGQLFLLEHTDKAWSSISEVQSVVRAYKPGGLIAFGPLFSGSKPATVSGKLEAAQAASDIPLMISTDEEGGIVARVSGNGGTAFRPAGRFLSPQQLLDKAGGNRTAALELVRKQGAEMAELLLGLGVNMDHAPVADTITTGKQYYNGTYRTPTFANAYMGGTSSYNARAWNGTVEDVAAYAAAAAGSMEDDGLGTTLKHFPSYGNAAANGHNEMVVYSETEYSLAELYEMMIPFVSGIEAGGEGLMITHNIYDAFDADNSMSMSAELYDFLRNGIGFDGLAMTDDVEMEGISIGGRRVSPIKRSDGSLDTSEAAMAAIAAGADMVITSDSRSIAAAARRMDIDGAFGARVEESCRRVLCWKMSHGLIDADEILAGQETGPEEPDDPKEPDGDSVPSGTLRISGVIEGATYRIYPVLSLDPLEGDGAGSYRYRFAGQAAMREILIDLIDGGFGLGGSYGTMPVDGAVSVDGASKRAKGTLQAGFRVMNADDGGAAYVIFGVRSDPDDPLREVLDGGEEKALKPSPQELYDIWLEAGDTGSSLTTGTIFMMRFAEALKDRIEDEAVLGSCARTVAAEVGEPGYDKAAGTLTVEGLAEGFYMVISGSGKRAMAFSMPGDGCGYEIEEKNEAPTLSKLVLEDADGKYHAANDKAIGDTAYFRAAVDTGRSAGRLKFVDEMSGGLSFARLAGIWFYPRGASPDGSDGVSLCGDAGVASDALRRSGYYDGGNVAMALSDGADGGSIFAIAFSPEWLASVAGDPDDPDDDGGTIVIEYAAKINGRAVVGGAGNENRAKVLYGNDPDVDGWLEAAEAVTRTYVYEMDILKHVLGDRSAALAGARFELYRAGAAYGYDGASAVDTDAFQGIVADREILVPEEALASANHKLMFVEYGTGRYRLLDPAEYGSVSAAGYGGYRAVDAVESDGEGRIMIEGLDADLYKLVEIRAPAGYLLADKPIYVVLARSAEADDGAAGQARAYVMGSYDGNRKAYAFEAAGAASEPGTVAVANAGGLRMPDTGGMGSAAFRAGGLCLLAAGCAAYAARRRMKGAGR